MNDELYHHGILGQRWGIRRYQNSDGSYTSLGRRRRRISGSGNSRSLARRDALSAVKNRRTLSDEELDARIKRLEKEKKLKDLTTEDIIPGKKFVKNVMSDSGKKILTTVISGAALYGVGAALNKKQNKNWEPDYADMAKAVTGLSFGNKSEKKKEKD